jgi:hypothetical protein
VPNTTERLTRNNIRMFAALIEAAVQSVAQHHGVDIRYDRASFTDAEGTIKLRIAVKNAPGKPEGTSLLAAKAAKFGVTDVTAKFMFGGFEYEIVDVVPNRPKYPFLARRADGKKFKMSAAVVKQMMETAKV